MDNQTLENLLTELTSLDTEGSYKEADKLEKTLHKMAQVGMNNSFFQQRERFLNNQVKQRSQGRSQQWQQQPSQGKERDYQSQLKLYLEQLEDHLANNPMMDRARQSRLLQERDRISKLLLQH